MTQTFGNRRSTGSTSHFAASNGNATSAAMKTVMDQKSTVECILHTHIIESRRQGSGNTHVHTHTQYMYDCHAFILLLF